MKPSINLDAFQRGFVFWENPKAEYMPPLDDIGRQEWLEGFLQAHADYPPTRWTPRRERQRRKPWRGCWKGIRRCPR